MKYLIHLVFMFALVGCDPTPDIDDNSGEDASAPAAGAGEALAAAEVPAEDAAEGPRASVIQFGIYSATKKGRIGESSQTNTGKVVRKPVLEHVRMRNRIPLVKDTYFGFQYRLWNLPTEVTVKRVMPLRSVLIHPEMTLPDGSTSTGWDRPKKGIVKSQQVIGFEGYAFNEDYELVEGEWIFQVWYGDQKLLERKFVTVPPKQGETAETAETE
jgi:hypothetical protein